MHSHLETCGSGNIINIKCHGKQFGNMHKLKMQLLFYLGILLIIYTIEIHVNLGNSICV